MKEYFLTKNKEHAFILDEDGDRLTSFDVAFDYIKNNLNPISCECKHDFFDGAIGFFIKDNIKVNIVCSNWFGTEIRIPENELLDSDLSKVRQWAEEIYNFIHNNESPT
jgi:hypothetical protein